MKVVIGVVLLMVIVIMALIISEGVGYIMKLARDCAMLRKSNQMLDKWLQAGMEEDAMGEYLYENNYKKVAIHGMGKYGIRLLHDLQKSNFVEVSYAIDRVVQAVNCDLPVYNLEDNLPEVDLVIISPIEFKEQIKEDLRKKTDYPIIALDELIVEI